MYNILIVKYGEIGVKGKNRYIFENKLIKNVKNMLIMLEQMQCLQLIISWQDA